MRRFRWPLLAIFTVFTIGTIGYILLGRGQHSVLNAIYMVVITITTVGFGEIIDLSANPGGRIFTMFIAISGIGALTYTLTNFTAYIVEGDINDSFRRRRMEKRISRLKNHYIVCGVDQVGNQVLNELRATKRECVVVDINIAEFQKEGASNSLKDQLYVEGNATQDATLLTAGIQKARGLFVTTGDDALNIVICLTAKQINSNIRVVARCNEVQNEGKIKKAGADAVVTPGRIGGLRMASEMTRQTVVSFLDIMLRDTTDNLRVEEMAIPTTLVGKPISKLDLNQYDRALLLAIKTNDEWYYNPPGDYILQIGDILIVMTTAVGRIEMEERFLD